MFFEIYKKGNLIIRGRQILNTLSIDNELMVAPSTTMVLPIDYLSVIDGREEIKLYPKSHANTILRKRGEREKKRPMR